MFLIELIMAFRSIIAGAVIATLGFVGFWTDTSWPLVIAGAGVIWLLLVSSTRESGPSGSREIGNIVEGSKNIEIPSVSFDDIAGHRRAKQELQEAVEFLSPQSSLEEYGIRPLKGILLTGPPGTGKTMLARAVAHRTRSYFLSMSGSQFVEKYAGIGAGRVRQLFQRARSLARKKNRGAVIFIDEIDAIGGKRSSGESREYDQTLNQLLTEMDGVTGDQNAKILIVAATNYREILDEALLRPGRFDRQVAVQLPDQRAREEILRLHMRGKPIHSGVDVPSLARGTFGFSGAQLESLANEAAVYAMRGETEHIEQQHFAMALDKVMMGERTDRKVTLEEKRRVAVHELGHALMSETISPGSVAHISLQSRDRALGYVHRKQASQDCCLLTEQKLRENLEVIMAGPGAEELVFGQTSTGTKGDYEQACEIAREIIMAGWSGLGVVDPSLVTKEELHTEVQGILEKTSMTVARKLAPMQPCLEHCLPHLLQEESVDGKTFRRHLLKYTAS
ncbi:AAA family ATPase [Pasteuria penetrans]|uniref:AAA family ATPase n=1 Tax=Pasteuria penetrans TaxID=86005 RepID=UPI000FB0BD83|nr:AAA family ATPase [Pasteuria penetrans]